MLFQHAVNIRMVNKIPVFVLTLKMYKLTAHRSADLRCSAAHVVGGDHIGQHVVGHVSSLSG